MKSICVGLILLSIGLVSSLKAENDITICAPDSPHLEPSVQEREDIEKICATDRYMAENKGTPISYPNWEKFSRDTKLYTYKISEKTGKWAAGKEVQVVLINPPADRAAHWVASAIKAKYEHYNHSCAMRLARYIHNESQFQFPIAGIVDEQEKGVFVFRDGIAVRLKGLPTIDGPEKKRALVHSTKFGKTDIDYAMNAPEADISNIGYKARPCSIRLEEFLLPHICTPDGETPWNRKMLRVAYQNAFYADNMPLITNCLLACGDALLVDTPEH